MGCRGQEAEQGRQAGVGTTTSPLLPGGSEGDPGSAVRRGREPGQAVNAGQLWMRHRWSGRTWVAPGVAGGGGGGSWSSFPQPKGRGSRSCWPTACHQVASPFNNKPLLLKHIQGEVGGRPTALDVGP